MHTSSMNTNYWFLNWIYIQLWEGHSKFNHQTKELFNKIIIICRADMVFLYARGTSEVLSAEYKSLEKLIR